MSANQHAEAENLLADLAATAGALRLHDAGRAAARARRIELVAQARAMGVSHQRIARALDSSRALSQYLVAQGELRETVPA